MCLMQLTPLESRASSTCKDRARTLSLLSEKKYVTNKKVSEEGGRKKIKYVVKLILFYTIIRCYITFKKRGNQRELNSNLKHDSQALKPLRYTALLEKGPNKRVYK